MIRDKESTVTEEKPSSLDTRFYLFAAGVVLLSIVTRVFDFGLVPPIYNGVQITRSFCGLHSWDLADRAWAARSHVKYGLGYTKGLRTLVVGDPPPAHPQYYVSHPPLESWILALGMLLLGTEDWSFRLIDLIISVPCLFLILLLLRRLYGSACALLAGLLLALLPLSGYFGFEPLMVLLGLWALYRYLQLTGRLGDEAAQKKRHLIELAVALFLIVQWNWVGILSAFVIGVHFVGSCLVQRQAAWRVLAVLIVAPLLGLTLNFYFMISGFRNNIVVEEAAKESPAEMKISRGRGVAPLAVKFEPPKDDTTWSLMKTLYNWRAREGEVGSFSWEKGSGFGCRCREEIGDSQHRTISSCRILTTGRQAGK